MPLDSELEPHLAEAARLNNLDPQLLRALLAGESSFNPNATSEKNAQGIAQIIPSTAKQYGIDDPLDPVQGIYGGAHILNDALTKAEQLKASGRDIVPVEYALKTYFAGPEGPQWGPKTDAYPSYIASKYQTAPKQDNSQPSGVDQLAAAGSSQGPVKTNAIGEQYQQDGEGGWHLVGNPQGRAAVRALTPSSPGYAATRGPGNDVGINISPLTGKPYQDPPLSPADPLNGNGKPYVVPDNFPQERAAQIKTGAGMDGIDQLAAAGQPQPAGDIPPGVMQLAQAGQGGMSDEALLKGFVDGTLPFMQKPPATPAAAPQPAQAAAPQTVTGAPTQPPQSTAAPALDVPGLIDTYNRYRSFPAGLPLAQGALGMLQKMAPEGYVLGQDGSLSLRPGMAQGTADIQAAKEGQKIEISRSGAITKGGAYIGHVPLETSVVDTVTGNKYPAFTPPMGSAAGAAMPQPGAAPAASPSTGLSPPNAIAPNGIPAGAVMGAPSELGPGAHEALVARAKEEQDTRQQTINSGATAQMQQATLQRMAADAPNFYTGPFANHVQDANSILRLFNPDFNEKVASYEDFSKNAGQLVRTAVHDTSPRAAVQEFKLIGGALPNPEMSPIGLSRVLNEYMGLNDYRIAKTQAQQGWEQQHGGIGNVSGFETDWQANVSPYAFMVARMNPADRQALFSNVAAQKGGADELSHLTQQIQYITKTGLDKFIR